MPTGNPSQPRPTLPEGTGELDRRAIDTVRVLAMDAVQKAGNGHPGTAMSVGPPLLQQGHFLGPGGDETGKLYALLRDAMEKAGKAAVASFVMRGWEHLAAVRADGDILVLETLFFADEVRDPHQQITGLPGRVNLSRQELNMARQLIGAMSGPWKPADYRDTYADRVNDLIDAKKNDKEFQPAEEAPAATNVVDLAEALQSSVEAARKGSGRKAPQPDRKKTRTKKAPRRGSGRKSAA